MSENICRFDFPPKKKREYGARPDLTYEKG
jgi:hypothetical protein